MKFGLLLIVAICFIGTKGAVNNFLSNLHREPPIRTVRFQSRATVETKWIMQYVDNFDPQNPSTWSMRYLDNGEHYTPGGPLFIYVGGEWTISSGTMSGGHFYDMARELGAYLFYTEHRFYGLSRPTPSTSTDLLRFLNIDQALADLAHFVEEMRRTIPGAENSPVILAGGSYAGTMVTWFRQKYPHLANGVWASSAPLQAKLDFYEYKEVVTESIRLVGGDECADRIQGAYDEIEMLLEAKDYATLHRDFKICNTTDLTNKLDVSEFLSGISNLFAGVVQYHKTGDIEGVCNSLTSEESLSDMAALAKWVTRFVTTCFNFSYKEGIAYYSNINWNHGANDAMRQWMYQTCAEYGWYQTSASEAQVFGSGFPVEFYVQSCIDQYSGVFDHPRLDANIERTNVIFGAMNPAVTNVFFTQGQLDPWRPMGIQEDLNENAPAVVIPLASHCADFGSISDSDSPEMRAAKERILELIKQWIA